MTDTPEAQAREIESEWYSARTPAQIAKELQDEWELRRDLRELVDVMRDGLADHGALCPCASCVDKYGPVKA